MNERLLQYIWQFQYFNKTALKVEQGQELTIIHPGTYNTHQGPDFLDGKVTIGNTTWAGNIEIHINSSDWIKHTHGNDINYSNVILHVVWNNDGDIAYYNGSILPTLELHNLVSKLLLDRFRDLMARKAFVPCEAYLPVFNEMKWTAWKERMIIERLQRKSAFVLELLKEAKNHWEEVFWWMLARNFGIRVNADIFEAIAKSLPLNIVGRHKNQIHQLEGFLLGQAGLLNHEFSEDYPNLLKKEYLFYQKKYQLKRVFIKPFFLRMRPANFPTIRLAQLAMLVHKSSHLFSKIKETDSVTEIKKLLNVTANDYWHYHYLLDEPGDYHPKQLGKQMVENIIINTVTPVLFAYGLLNGDTLLKDKALEWLAELSPEKNSITQTWTSFGVTSNSALESQALIELKNSYCNKKRCLECAVGNSILKGHELIRSY
ncbi:DUF2851 family protein [Segetibacter aerophilus]|uniref:DUF2851 domain-containing protein n=1 Tax=Segetibacter aerophilus TaxID=670293 RepID=A0A512B913_9BACT|nr:DUF2851 family protein [Segetibacter aerophilus]GEO08433.1 hypothetical protein SAE01_09290 [Segetibacter aerophilus]